MRKKFKVFLMPIGVGRLINKDFTKEEIEKSFDYVRILSEINETIKDGKDWVAIKVDRNKLRLMVELLRDKGYEVKEQ